MRMEAKETKEEGVEKWKVRRSVSTAPDAQREGGPRDPPAVMPFPMPGGLPAGLPQLSPEQWAGLALLGSG